MVRTREIITINVGGAGVRIGEAITKQYMSDQKITKSGDRDNDRDGEESCGAFFEETGAGKFQPRQVSVDLDPKGMEDIETGELRQLFHRDFLLSGTEDAGNNFARGHYTVGKEIMDKVTDRVRKLVDNCDDLQGFIINHSLGGGTGSGLGSLILDRIAVDYRRKLKFGFEVLAGDCTGRVAPCGAYNEMLATHKLLDSTDLSLVFDNRQLSKICQEDYKITAPTYKHVNSLIAKVASGFTKGLCNDRVCLDELQLALVPFPRLHFMTGSFAGNLKEKTPLPTVKDLTSLAVDSAYMTVHYPKFDSVKDKYMAMLFCYRGDVGKKDADATVKWVKQQNKVSFVEWCPTGSKVDVDPTPMGEVQGDEIKFDEEKSVTGVGNCSAMVRNFTANAKKYDMMYSQRAYVHQYVSEGMEEGAFAEAREDIGFLEKDYADIVAEHGEDDEDDEDF